MLRIAFAGTPAFALPALDALAASRWSLCGVLTQPDRPAGRGRELAASPVKQRALALGLPVAQPARLRSEEEQAPLRAWAPDLLVVVAYGLILPPAVLAIPRLGCLNIHGSLLPRWRGAAPVQRALLAGDAGTGVCIMQMDAGLDTGPVYASRAVAIGPRATSASLADELAHAGASLLLEVVAALEAGTARAQPQPAEGASYAAKIAKAEGLVDWSRSAVQIDRQVRGCNPWPVAETQLDGVQLRLWQARVAPPAEAAVPAHPPAPVPAQGPAAAPGTVLSVDAQGVHVACGEGVLLLEEVQPAGKRRMAAAEFARARPLAGRVLGGSRG